MIAFAVATVILVVPVIAWARMLLTDHWSAQSSARRKRHRQCLENTARLEDELQFKTNGKENDGG